METSQRKHYSTIFFFFFIPFIISLPNKKLLLVRKKKKNYTEAGGSSKTQSFSALVIISIFVTIVDTDITHRYHRTLSAYTKSTNRCVRIGQSVFIINRILLPLCVDFLSLDYYYLATTKNRIKTCKNCCEHNRLVKK